MKAVSALINRNPKNKWNKKDAFPVKEQEEMMGNFLLETMQTRKENIFPAWKGDKGQKQLST